MHPSGSLPSPRHPCRCLQAFEEVNRICEHPDFHLSYQLQPGDVQILSNYSQFHTRTAFTDPEPGEVRQGLGGGGKDVGLGGALPQAST